MVYLDGRLEQDAIHGDGDDVGVARKVGGTEQGGALHPLQEVAAENRADAVEVARQKVPAQEER